MNQPTNQLSKEQLEALQRLSELTSKLAEHPLPPLVHQPIKSKTIPATAITSIVALLGSVLTYVTSTSDVEKQDLKAESSYNILIANQQEQNAIVRERLRALEVRIGMIHEPVRVMGEMHAPTQPPPTPLITPECLHDDECGDGLLCDQGLCIVSPPAPEGIYSKFEFEQKQLPTYEDIDKHVKSANTPYPMDLHKPNPFRQ